MYPFTLERPQTLAAALQLRAQAGRTDAPVSTSPVARTWCSCCRKTFAAPSGW
jgi:hypothetical protein